MSLEDPRWRFVLHMNWKAQSLPVLVNGLPSKAQLGARDPRPLYEMPQPSAAAVAAISPRAQVERGPYATPTFLIHGTADDLIPWQQSQRTHESLARKGVDCGIAVVEGADHLFDLFGKMDETGRQGLKAGYDFLFKYLKPT